MGTATITTPRQSTTASLAMLVLPVVAISASNIALNSKDYFDAYSTIPEMKWIANRFDIYQSESNELLRLKEIAQLPDDWNGYGAKSISAEIIEKGKNLILELNRKWIDCDLFPTQRATLQIEFELEAGTYFEIEVKKDKFELAEIIGEAEKEYTFNSIEEVIAKVS